jgi:hypothetical protein
VVGERAEDAVGDDRATGGDRRADTERQVIEDQHLRPLRRAARLEHDRREHLHPVLDERAVARGVRRDRVPGRLEPVRQPPHVATRRAVGHSLPDTHERRRDLARREETVAHRREAAVLAERTLAVVAVARGRVLARQRLREDVRLVAVAGDALVALPTTARSAVGAVEPDGRTLVPGTGRTPQS